MTIRVLVVDDSRFYRNRLTEMLTSDEQLQIVGTAENGQEAVEKAAILKPDVITMDVEMPIMDGITAVQRIMAQRPTPILMFSTVTSAGAKATLDALDAGAADFINKKFDDIAGVAESVEKILCEKIRALATRRSLPAKSTEPRVPKFVPKAPAAPERTAPIKGKASVVAIGTSTGGPAALQQVLTKVPGDYPVPILLVQHMPAAFTGPFAQRLNSLCKIEVKEAADGDMLVPGTAYLAPGGRQMIVEKAGLKVRVRIREPEPDERYKPSVDVTFLSVARAYGGQVLAIVMTGMGNDGRTGAAELKQAGAALWAQNEPSCVVYGMPAAVVEAGLADQVLDLTQIGAQLAQGI